MPDLGKQKSSVPVLADSENDNNNGNNSGSPCDALETQEQGNQSLIPQDFNEWWQKAKQSSWLPWTVAAGFGVLWLRKGKGNN